jgi:hypothetical protein
VNVNTGATYPSLTSAVEAGEDPADLVEVVGTSGQVERLSKAVAEANRKARSRAANKRARASRKRNR